MLDHAADGLHDDLLRVEHFANDEAESRVANLAHYYDIVLRTLSPRQTEECVEVRERQQRVAKAQELGAMDVLDRTAFAHPHELDDADLRNREPFAGYADDQAGDDRERQRNPNANSGADTDTRRQLDDAADALDVAADDVHAHTASRDIRDFLGRREAGLEDQAQ